MPFGLLKYGPSKKYSAKHHFTRATTLKIRYDEVIIGAGRFSGEPMAVAALKVLASDRITSGQTPDPEIDTIDAQTHNRSSLLQQQRSSE